jgi:hypothetical protein
MAETVRLNVSGQVFNVERSTLLKHDGLLATALRDGAENLISLPRDATIFPFILAWYRDGPRMVLPADSVKRHLLLQEAKFYGLTELETHLLRQRGSKFLERNVGTTTKNRVGIFAPVAVFNPVHEEPPRQSPWPETSRFVGSPTREWQGGKPGGIAGRFPPYRYIRSVSPSSKDAGISGSADSERLPRKAGGRADIKSSPGAQNESCPARAGWNSRRAQLEVASEGFAKNEPNTWETILAEWRMHYNPRLLQRQERLLQSRSNLGSAPSSL